MGDEPPYLSVGTEVSAKYKGAFCEAKIRKVVRSVKCKVIFKQGLGPTTVADDQIKGVIRNGGTVEVKLPDKKELLEATITKIQDCSQYTVVFDDGDITTLRRTALCLKSGRHFAEGETLDQLPLTHPEHFSNPVIGGRRGRRARVGIEESSEDEEAFFLRYKDFMEDKEEDIGRVVCVEGAEKKKQKDNWFPGLVVAPTAQDTVTIDTRLEYLVRSFKDGRYYTVPKKEALEFTREIGSKAEGSILKAAVEKALQFLDKDDLPPHWDRDSLFGLNEMQGTDSEAGYDCESSDDEPTELKDHFVAQLYKFMDDSGTPINKGPTIGSQDVDLYKLYKIVNNQGGFNRVTNQNNWKLVSAKLGFGNNPTSISAVKQVHKKFLYSFEDFNRKLGCTLVPHPRTSRSRSRSTRTLIRDRDKAIKQEPKSDSKENSSFSTKEDSPSIGISSALPVRIKIEPGLESPEQEDTLLGINKNSRKSQEVNSGEEIKIKQEPFDMKEEISEVKKTRQKKARTRLIDQVIGGKNEANKSTNPVNKEKKRRLFPRGKKEKNIIQTLKKTTLPIRARHKTALYSNNLKSFGEYLKLTRASKMLNSAFGIQDNIDKASHTSRNKVKEDQVLPKVKKEESVAAVSPIEDKKRTRRRKEKAEIIHEGIVPLPCYKTINVGDKLTVYYGPKHDPKVTYEAKVLDIRREGSDTMYLVHYFGWNNRYDEWIKHSRIADNLSSGRSTKRSLQVSRGGRKRNTPVKTGNDSNFKSNTDSTAYASNQVTDTKTDNNLISPQAINKIKGTRANTRSSIRRVASVSETEEYESDSMSVESTAFSKRKVLVAQERLGTVNVPTNDRRGRKRKSIESEGKDKFDCDCGLKKTPMQTKRAYKTRETTRRRNDVKNAKDEDANTSKRSENSSSEANIGSVEILSKFEGFDGYSDDDYALYIDSDSDQEGDETIKTETITDEETEKLLQKGRDFDLNEIRSELKGIESAVGSNASIKIDQGFGEDGSLAEDKEINEEHIKEDQNNANNINATLHNPVKQEIEDVYEFKEPEPFEFESRKMDDKNKLQRRTLSRCYLDESRLSPQRKKLKPSSPTFSSKSTHISETINLTASKETPPTDISAISVPRTYPKYNKFMQASSSIFAPLFEHADDSIDLSKVKIKRDRVRGSWGNLDVSYIKGDKTRELIKITITPDTNSKGDPGTPDSFTSGSSSDEPLSPTIDEMYEPDKYPSKTIAKYKAYRERLLKEFSSPDKESSAIPPVNESETPTVNEETPTLSFKESPISSLNEPAVLPLNQPVSSINNKANVSSLNDGSSSLNKTITALNKVTNLINKPPSLTVNDSFTSSLNRMTASLTNTAVMPLSKMPPMLYNATSSLSSTSPASLLNNASNLLNVPPASLLNEPSLTSSTNNSTLLSTVTNTEYSPCKVPAQSSDQLYSSSVKSPNPAAETEDASFNGMKSNCTLERKEMDPNFTLSTYEDVDSKDFTIEILDKDESSPKSEMKENINIDHEMEQLERRFEEECELVKDKNRELEVDESKVTEEVEGLDDISVLEEIEDTADVDESSEVVVSEVGEVGEVDDTHEEEEGTEEYEAADDDLTDIEETADVVEETGEIVETTEVEMGDIVETGELLEKQIEPADDIEAGNSEETTEATESEEPMEEDETEVVEINAMEEKETEVAEVEVEDEDDEEMEEVVKPEIYNIEFSEEKSTTDEFMDIGNTTSATKDDDDPDEEDNEVDDEQEDEDDPKDEGDDEEDDVEEDCVRAVMKEEETEKKDKMNGKNKSVVKDEDDEDDEEENLISLLCNEEIIPRSPNPQADEAQEEEEEDKNILVVTEIDNDEGLPLSEKLDNDFHREKDVKEAAVEENSPPPSPDSSTSSVSSPIQERPVEPVGTKHNSEYEVDSAPQKNGSEDTQRLRIDARLKKIEGRVSMKKGRRSRKQSQDLGRKKYSRSIRNHASDSDEFYDTPRISSPREIVHRLSRNGKYNFLVKIDSQNSPDYNIALLMQALHNLRNCYQEVKSELTVIDRKRKRFRRRERENGQPTNRYH